MNQRCASAIVTLSFVALAACCATSDAGTFTMIPVVPVVPVVPEVPVVTVVPAFPIAPVVPDALAPPVGQKLLLGARGVGVQIYECRGAKDDPLRFEWVFKAPEAELFDSSGKKIGRHYAGPTWESDDGSSVVGEVRASDKGPDPDAIPWLLLGAKTTSGNGVLSRTQSIQRLDTVGGKAPVEGCSRMQAGTVGRVPYKAMYYFYGTGQ